MGPFRARRDKTTFPRVNPGLYFVGPLGQNFLRRPLSRNVQTEEPLRGKDHSNKPYLSGYEGSPGQSKRRLRQMGQETSRLSKPAVYCSEDRIAMSAKLNIYQESVALRPLRSAVADPSGGLAYSSLTILYVEPCAMIKTPIPEPSRQRTPT